MSSKTQTIPKPTSVYSHYLESRKKALLHIGEMIQWQWQIANSSLPMASPSQSVLQNFVATPTVAPAIPTAPPIIPTAPISPHSTVAEELRESILVVEEPREPIFREAQLQQWIVEQQMQRIANFPQQPLLFLHRVMAIEGKVGHWQQRASITTEYDLKQEDWYMQLTTHPSYIPQAILQEIGTQSCQCLSAYLGTSLPDEKMYCRAIGGNYRFLQEIQGFPQTIAIEAKLVESVEEPSSITQFFEYELSHLQEVFFKGEITLRYVTQEIITREFVSNQEETKPFERYCSPETLLEFDLESTISQQRLYQSSPEKPHYRIAGEQLEFLERVSLQAKTGKYHQGYVYAEKTVEEWDWFYAHYVDGDAHMPSSFIVETALEGLSIFALAQNLGKNLNSPRFRIGTEKVSWKIFHQVDLTHQKIELEIHIKKIETSPAQIDLIAEANLWVDKNPLAEIQDLSLSLIEST